MKKNIILSLFVLSIFLSCEEDSIRPLVDGDSIGPGTIENVVVENINGGANLTYNLPDNSDLLYVEAQFTRQEGGEISKVRSSVFNNRLVINGFGEEKDFDVTLFAVDQSENKSAPVNTVVSPKKPPFLFVCESIAASPDFGGVFFSWDNPLLEEISVEVSVIDEFGVPQLLEVAYSANVEGSLAVRGFEPVETTFVVVIKDRFGNKAPTKTFKIIPIFEEAAPKFNYAVVRQPHDSEDFNNRWRLDRIYNGNVNGGAFNAYLSQGNWVDPDPTPEYTGINAHMFTLDIGAELKVSRVFYHAPAYSGGAPRFFDVWGTNQLNPDGSFDGWVKIVDGGESIKPSGLPVGTNTAEDDDTAARGIDIIADSGAPSVRYIRFVNKQTWSEAPALQINEIEFFGQIIE